MSDAARLWRRIWNAMGFGAVSIVDDSAAVQKAQIQLGQVEIHDDVPVVQLFGFSGNAPAGTQAVVLFVGGDRSNPIVVATNDPASRPTDLKSGETKVYDNAGKYIYLSAGGIEIEAKGLPVTVNDATTVTINAATEVVMKTPILKVSGDIVDNYQTNPNSMAAMRSLYDQHTHTVPNVQTGSSTVTTDTPTPQE